MAYIQAVSERRLSEAAFSAIWFPGAVPADLRGALDSITHFIRRSEDPIVEASDGPQAYDFAQDADIIIAGFQHQYHIDITRAHMHWWRFAALLDGLYGLDFAKLVEVRTKDLSGMQAKERARWLKLRGKVAVQGEQTVSYEDHIAELDRIIKGGQ